MLNGNFKGISITLLILNQNEVACKFFELCKFKHKQAEASISPKAMAQNLLPCKSDDPSLLVKNS
jgi:hypothetical protein